MTAPADSRISDEDIEDLLQWFSEPPHYSRDRLATRALTELRERRAQAVTVKPEVTRDDAIKFLESACRNWSRVPKLSEDDIGDVASSLLQFLIKRTAVLPPICTLKGLPSSRPSKLAGDDLVARLRKALAEYDRAVEWHSYRRHDVDREAEQHKAAARLAEIVREALTSQLTQHTEPVVGEVKVVAWMYPDWQSRATTAVQHPLSAYSISGWEPLVRLSSYDALAAAKDREIEELKHDIARYVALSAKLLEDIEEGK